MQEEDGGTVLLKVEDVPCAVVATRMEAVLAMAAAMYAICAEAGAVSKKRNAFHRLDGVWYNKAGTRTVTGAEGGC